MSHAPLKAEQDAVDICAGLVRFDTTNFGGGESRGERDAAEYAAGLLTEAGAEPRILESAPGRANVVCRIPGTDSTAPGLLVHGHLDVVPANAADWSTDPFSGEVAGGMVWGRGTLDMKSAIAAVLAACRRWARDGVRPRRDIVLALVADEEDTGGYGAGFLTREHPDLLAGVSEAIGEGGGGLVHMPGGQRLHSIGVAERGTMWMQLTATGTAGHGSRPTADNPVTAIASAVARIGAHEWPIQLTPPVRQLLEKLQEATDQAIDPNDLESARPTLGDALRLVESVLRNTTSPTMLDAGYKVNVIPGAATAHVDGRVLPGHEEEFLGTLERLVGEQVRISFDSRQDSVQSPFEGPTVDAMVAALDAEDPGAIVVPGCSGGGTDAKWFSQLGIACYGFAPLGTPADFQHRHLVHGVDERVPVTALEYGVRVLDRFLLGS
ncbi:MAG: M20/M25/M40 family metallo-hydrolase [Streptosporangiales bacterium]